MGCNIINQGTLRNAIKHTKIGFKYIILQSADMDGQMDKVHLGHSLNMTKIIYFSNSWILLHFMGL